MYLKMLIAIFLSFLALPASADYYPEFKEPICYVRAYDLTYVQVPLSLSPSWMTSVPADAQVKLVQIEPFVFELPSDIENHLGMTEIEVQILDDTVFANGQSDFGPIRLAFPLEVHLGNLLNYKGFEFKARATHYSATETVDYKPWFPSLGDKTREYQISCSSKSWYTDEDGYVLKHPSVGRVILSVELLT